MHRLLIIPAAGLGSRLKSSIPKVLFPVNSRPMLDYLFELYASVVERFILVLHPSFAEAVQRYCASFSLPIEYEFQETPTGMLDAILIPQARVRQHRPMSIWITWCDQITVSPRTILKLAEFANQDPEAALIFPTVERTQPYVHLVRNAREEIIAVQHRREGEQLPQTGESDMGLFCLSPNTYLNLLPEFSEDGMRGAVTGERNFLPFIPWLCGRARVRTFPGCHEIEAVGINTAVELTHVEHYLRHAGQNPLDHYTRL
ncbi:MAG: NTP transferase domain-containing protein [Candidatus Entotheonellia bacterium]